MDRDANAFRNFQVNNTFLIVLLITLGCGGFQMGHVIACTNTVSSVFIAKFESFRRNPTLWLSILGSSGILGNTIGALSGSQVIKIGRRNAFMLASLVALGGSFFSLVETPFCIILGRLIYGLGCGVLSVTGPRFIEETVPDRLLTLYQPLFITCIAFGAMMSLVLGAGLPPDNGTLIDMEALKNDSYWKVIMGAPIPLQILSILLMFFYVKYDTIRYLTYTGKFNEAREMIK